MSTAKLYIAILAAGLAVGLVVRLDGGTRYAVATLAVGLAILLPLDVLRQRTTARTYARELDGNPSRWVGVMPAAKPPADAERERRERERRAELERWDVLRTMVEGAAVHGLGRRAWAGKRTRNGTRISQTGWAWAINTLKTAHAIRQNGQGYELVAPPSDILSHFGLAASETGRLFNRTRPPADARQLVRV